MKRFHINTQLNRSRQGTASNDLSDTDSRPAPPGTELRPQRADSASDEMASHFNKAKWLNFFGQSGASMLTVALCWPLASSAGLISFLAVHQVLLLIVIAAFASPLGRRWVDGSGMPKMTAPALAVTQTIGGSVMWFDLLASQDITFALAALLVIYASAAFTVATLGPMRDLARLVLFASLLPSTVATLYCGHYLLGIATLVFIGVVGLYGIAQIHSAYMQLLRMQNESAQDARAANEMARRDSLTGLLNRDGVAEQYKLHQTDLRSAFFIDLDRFKKVNDEAGHLAGDELLRQVATRLNRCVPAGSIVARVGGDEFLILMTLDDLDRLNTLGEEIIVRLEESFVLPVGTYAISASIGICLIQAEQTLERVFHEADNAMYRAKRNGRARVKVFTKDMDLELKARSDLEKELVWLIDRGEFPIYGQPIFDLATGDVRAVEVLIRPRFRDGKRYSPAAVLPVLEELKLLDIMTGIVLQQATRARSEWRSIPALRNAAVSINIPAQSLTSDWLVHEVRNLIAQYSLEPGDLIFEITEYALTSDVEKSRLTLLALRDIGVQISLDDFGIGHSSLSQLLSFPLSLVKIDKSVIQHVDQLSQSRRFMEAIIEVASSLGHDVVAEGIESQAQLDAVYAAGATLGQGFLFSHPKPIDVLIATLGNQKKSSLSVRPARRKPGAVRLPRARGGDRAVSTSG